MDLLIEAVEQLELTAQCLQEIIELHEQQHRNLLFQSPQTTQNLHCQINETQGMKLISVYQPTVQLKPDKLVCKPSKTTRVGSPNLAQIVQPLKVTSPNPRHNRNIALCGSCVHPTKLGDQYISNDNPQDSTKRFSIQPNQNVQNSFINTDLKHLNSKQTSPTNMFISSLEDQNTAQVKMSDQDKIEEAFANKLHKSRYLGKVILQMCALLSQTGKHQDALLAAQRAAQTCFDMIKSAHVLSKRYVQRIQRAHQHITKESSDFTEMYIDESVSQASNEYQQQAFLSQRTPLKRNPSGDSQRTNSINSEKMQGIIKLKLARNKLNQGSIDKSSAPSSRVASALKNDERGQSSSVESLDRIHTFNLKNAQSKIINKDQKLKGYNIEDNQQIKIVDMSPKNQSESEYNSVPQQQLQSKLTSPKQSCEIKIKLEESPNKTVYIEENLKVLEKIILEADPILTELTTVLTDFQQTSSKTAINRDIDLQRKYGIQQAKEQRRKLHISFSEERELNELKNDQRFKLNARNNLGLLSRDDWIFNLNIGNVMYLNCLQTEELNTVIDKTHEFSKDAMLEKVVLISTAYFCIAMEIKFLLSEAESNQTLNCIYSRKDPETFHAKALHIVLVFLPESCPLAQHIYETYYKSYLKTKLKKANSKVLKQSGSYKQPIAQVKSVVQPVKIIQQSQINFNTSPESFKHVQQKPTMLSKVQDNSFQENSVRQPVKITIDKKPSSRHSSALKKPPQQKPKSSKLSILSISTGVASGITKQKKTPNQGIQSIKFK